MRASCTFNLHVCKFPGTIHRVIVPVETHDRGDVRFFSPVSRAICLDTTDVRRPNNQRRKPSRPLLKKKKEQFNLARAEEPKNPSRRTDPAKLHPRQDRFSPRTLRKSGRSKKISISLFRPGAQTASFGQRPVIYGAVTRPTYTGGYEPPN